jgi:hypothetical protein
MSLRGRVALRRNAYWSAEFLRSSKLFARVAPNPATSSIRLSKSPRFQPRAQYFDDAPSLRDATAGRMRIFRIEDFIAAVDAQLPSNVLQSPSAAALQHAAAAQCSTLHRERCGSTRCEGPCKPSGCKRGQESGNGPRPSTRNLYTVPVAAVAIR